MSDPFIVSRRGDAVVAGEGTARGIPSAPRRLRDAEAFGPLAPYVADESVTDIFVNGSAGLFVDRGSGAERVAEWRASEREVHDLATDLVGFGGRHVDDSSPLVDVRMPGGARVHVALSPIATGGTAISVRVPRLADVDLDGLRERVARIPRRAAREHPGHGRCRVR
jgi:pilus assembly protein CpaF